MGQILDNLIALRLLKMLTTPFSETDAFKLGIIDANGKILKKANSLTKKEQKDSYNYLTRLVFNVKRLINKTPGGENKLKNLTAAYFLVKECKEEYSYDVLEESYKKIIDIITEKEMKLVEDALAGAPANSVADAAGQDMNNVGTVYTGPAITTKYKPSKKQIARRKNLTFN